MQLAGADHMQCIGRRAEPSQHAAQIERFAHGAKPAEVAPLVKLAQRVAAPRRRRVCAGAQGRAPLGRAGQQRHPAGGERQLRQIARAAGPIGQHRGGDLFQPRQQRCQLACQIDKGAAGGDFVVDQYQRAEFAQRARPDGGRGRIQQMRRSMAVRFGKLHQGGAAQQLAGGVQEQRIAASAVPAPTGMHAVPQRDRGFGQADKQHRPGQVGADCCAQCVRSGAHSARAGRHVAAQHGRYDQEPAPRIVPRGKAAQIVQRPAAFVPRQPQIAGDQRHIARVQSGRTRRGSNRRIGGRSLGHIALLKTAGVHARWARCNRFGAL